MGLDVLTHNNMSWVNVENPTPADLDFLRQRFGLHPLDLEDIVSKVERPKLDEYDNYLFLIAHYPVYDHEQRASNPSEVCCFVGANYFVTVHDGRLRPLQSMFQECRQDKESARRHMSRGSGRLLYGVLDRLIDYCFPVLARVGGRLREIERDLPAGDPQVSAGKLLAVHRELIELDRMLRPQLEIVACLEAGSHPVIQPELQAYFGDISDSFRKACDLIEDYQRLASSMDTTLHVLVASRHVDVSRALVYVIALLVPLALIAGMFATRGGWSFAIGLALVLILSGVLLAYLRRRRWL